MKLITKKYIAFLRGINVGGHHKVPMGSLKTELHKLGCKNIVTLLNSGNIVFDFSGGNVLELEKNVSEHLEKSFGFPIPTIIFNAENIIELLSIDPFKEVVLTKDIRLYVSFLSKDNKKDFILPWTNDDKSYKILFKMDRIITSILDISKTKTPKGMEILQNFFGKDITTRNWNTIKRIEKLIESDS